MNIVKITNKNSNVYQQNIEYYCVNGDCEYTEEERVKAWCENGCWEGHCDPCPCSHDPEVEELIDDIALQQDLIDAEIEFLEEKEEEVTDLIFKIKEAFEKESENDTWDYVVDTISVIGLYIGAVYTGGTLPEILALTSSAVITEYSFIEKHPVIYKVPMYQKEIARIGFIIDHHKNILDYHRDLKEDFISNLHTICPCVLED